MVEQDREWFQVTVEGGQAEDLASWAGSLVGYPESNKAKWVVSQRPLRVAHYVFRNPRLQDRIDVIPRGDGLFDVEFGEHVNPETRIAVRQSFEQAFRDPNPSQ